MTEQTDIVEQLIEAGGLLMELPMPMPDKAIDIAERVSATIEEAQDEIARLRTALAEAEEARQTSGFAWRDSFDKMHQRAMTAEGRLSQAVEALQEAERIYYKEGKDATWRAAHMRGVISDFLASLQTGKGRNDG